MCQQSAGGAARTGRGAPCVVRGMSCAQAESGQCDGWVCTRGATYQQPPRPVVCMPVAPVGEDRGGVRRELPWPLSGSADMTVESGAGSDASCGTLGGSISGSSASGEDGWLLLLDGEDALVSKAMLKRKKKARDGRLYKCSCAPRRMEEMGRGRGFWPEKERHF